MRTAAEVRRAAAGGAAWGMLAEAAWAESEGISPDLVAQLTAALEALELRVDWQSAPIDLDAVGKSAGGTGRVDLAVIPHLGTCEVRGVPRSALVEFVRQRRRQ